MIHTLSTIFAWIGVVAVAVFIVALVAWLCFRNYDWERGG